MNKYSRSKIELFVECPHCFYLDQKMKVQRPKPKPYSLNTAVDNLLKKEFDIYRAKQQSHPMQASLGLIPSNHPKMDDWREALHKGVEYYHQEHNCVYRGGIDDLWVNPTTDVHYVVDYKCTAKAEKVVELPGWAGAYRRQMEIYQWLLRQNGVNVSDTAYFLYCTGDVHAPHFGNNLSFHAELIPYQGNDSWVSNTLNDLHHCLIQYNPPAPSTTCDWCKYRYA